VVKRRRVAFWITWGSGTPLLLWREEAESGEVLAWPLL